MKKFWNKNAATNEIYIYGDIVADKYFESEVTAKEFASDLNSMQGDVTVRINSNGGDCFSALAISNLMKESEKNISVSIDGICASAATLIACGGDKITMAKNALMMIHRPSVFLYDYCDAAEISKLQEGLAAVQDAIIETYKTRTGLTAEKLTEMIEAETWLTAAEAKELNFIDAIGGEAAISIDDAKELLIVNSLALKKEYFAKAKEKMKMTNKTTATLLEKIKNLLATSSKKSDVERIKVLNSERCGIGAVNAIIDVAIAEGKELSDVEKYINAVKNLPPEENKIADEILALIEDQLTSGAEGVGGSDGREDESKTKSDLIAKFANEMI